MLRARPTRQTVPWRFFLLLGLLTPLFTGAALLMTQPHPQALPTGLPPLPDRAWPPTLALANPMPDAYPCPLEQELSYGGVDPCLDHQPGGGRTSARAP